MPRRLLGSKPEATTAGSDLVDSLGDLVGATRRWLALQPVAQELPVYAERARQASSETVGYAGEWAGAKASQARTATATAASATRTAVINLLLVAVLLWWVDRMLTGGRGEA
jgi:hypothetical protein